MFSFAELAAMDDNELAIHLNGGYGAEKRRWAITAVRKALAQAQENSEAVCKSIVDRHWPEGPSAA